MNIIAVDPGLTNGLAWVKTGDYYLWEATQLQDIWHSFRWVEDHIEFGSTNVVLVEDFVGSGNLTKEGKETIKRLGLFSYYFDWVDIIEQPVPQKRKSQVSVATELCKSRDIPGPHSADALAHILAWMKRENVQGSIL